MPAGGARAVRGAARLPGVFVRGSLAVTSRPGPLRFAVVSGDRAARSAVEVMAAELERAAGVEVAGVLLGSYAELRQALLDGTVAFAWAPPVLVGELARAGAVEVLACSRRRSGATYHAVLFARRGAGLERPEQVRGRRAAWVDAASVSGYLLARRFLVERLAGTPGSPGSSARWGDLEGALAEQRWLGTHSAVVRAVLAGECDFGATYANLHPDTGAILDAGWSEVGASTDALLVLAELGPIPADGIVASRAVPPERRQQVARALQAGNPGLLASARVLLHAHGFVAPEPGYAAACQALARETSLRGPSLAPRTPRGG